MGVFAPFNAWYMKVLPLLIEVLAFLNDRDNAHSIFKAVENSASIIKAEWAYDSVMVDPLGRIIEKSVSTAPEERVLVSDVSLGSNRTVYSKTGDILGMFSLLGMFSFQLSVL